MLCGRNELSRSHGATEKLNQPSYKLNNVADIEIKLHFLYLDNRQVRFAQVV